MRNRTQSLYFCAMVMLGLACLAAAAPAAEVGARGNPIRSVPAPVTPQISPNQGVAEIPAQPVSMADYRNQPLNFAGSRRQARQEGERNYQLPSIWPALLCVMVVCAAFCAIMYLVKKYLPGHRQLFSHPAMEVLGRTHLDPKRYVSLLRVGKRIVVVGVSPDEMRPLSEITDEEEITGILEVARPKTEMGLNIFQRLFKRHVLDNEAAETEAIAREKAEELADQVSSLRERVRAIRASEEPPRRLDMMG